MKSFVKLFIFDFDGTLVNTSKDIAAAINHTLRRFNRQELSEDIITGYVGDGLLILLEKALNSNDSTLIAGAAKIFREYYSAHLLDNTYLYPGVLPLIKHFSDKIFSIASNKPKIYIEIILQKLGLLDNFKFIVGGDTTKNKKPSPEQLIWILKKAHVENECALMVGDSINDIKAALSAGIKSCYIKSGFNKGNDIKDVRPDCVVEDIFNIKDYFN
ncbi:MAG: HAD-IA family hydrolase [bacterium]